MKKLIASILVLIMSVSLCACGKPTPSDTVTSFLDSLKAQDTETLAAVYNGEELFETEGLYETELLSKILEFDYEIVNEKIDGNNASVEVKISTYDMGAAFGLIAEDFVKLLFTSSLEGNISEEEITQKLVNMLNSEIEKQATKSYTGQCVINLSQTTDGWIINEFEEDHDFLKVILGGLVEAFDELESAFADM